MSSANLRTKAEGKIYLLKGLWYCIHPLASQRGAIRFMGRHVGECAFQLVSSSFQDVQRDLLLVFLSFTAQTHPNLRFQIGPEVVFAPWSSLPLECPKEKNNFNKRTCNQEFLTEQHIRPKYMPSIIAKLRSNPQTSILCCMKETPSRRAFFD